jgi:pimeloyl-ACP methyl ester carboxylesterase
MPSIMRPDGRRITYDAIGDPSHPLVISIHGTPGSRVGSHPSRAAIDATSAYVVAFDRPGYGGSDRQPVRDVAAVAADVEALADALGASAFAVYGISGGGPHALACAALLPERVTRVASLVGVAPSDALDLDWSAGMSPSNVEEFAAAGTGREALAEMLAPVGDALRLNPDALVDMLIDELPPADVACLRDETFRRVFIGTITEAVRPGVDGWIDDDLAFVARWGFDPALITVPTLIWHGEDDVLVPVAHAHWLHGAIGTSTLVTVPGAGHLAAYAAQDSVLRWLADGTAL